MTEISNVPLFTGTVPDINMQSQSEFDAVAFPAAQYFLETLPPALNTLATEANALRSEVMTARDETASASQTALAASNYAGAWADLTGAVSIPTSVLHNDTYWALNTNLADVTASEPGVTTDWDEIATGGGAGAGDADRLEISANHQLTTDSPRKLAITATTGGLRVKLPLATDLEQDGQIWIISNTGAAEFKVLDYDNHSLGADMGAVAPNQTRAFYLVDQAAGTWVVLDLLASSTAGRVGEAGYIIDPNTSYVFESATSTYISIAALSDTKVIVAYRDDGNSNQGTACVLTISGTSITPGSPVVFESAGSSYISIAALSDTKAIVAYRDGGNSRYGTACVLTISGTTITPGSPVVFESASSYHISIAALSDTKAIVAYQDAGNSNHGTACVLTISGTTITPGSPVVFESADSRSISIAALSDTKAIVAYQDFGNSRYGTACVLTISGTSITPGPPVVFESANSIHISIAALSDTKAIVAYQDGGNYDYGTTCILGIDGIVITAGDPIVFNGAPTDYLSVAPLSDLKSIVAYRDDGNSSYGTAQILERR